MRELMKLEEMRNAATSINPKNIESIDIILGYVRQLSGLPQRFPINPDNIKITFAWMNTVPSTLDKEKPIASFELTYEILCCLYNASIILWQCGIDEFRRDSPESIKRALSHFQRAAGMFEHINGKVCIETASDSIPASSDLHTAQCMAKLMLAQGQECFYQNAGNHEQPSVKNSALARIALGASSLYTDCLRFANNSLFSFASSWKLHLEAKVSYWKALCEYQKGLDLLTKEQHGEAISRLNFSKSLLTRYSNEKKLHDLFRAELADLLKLVEEVSGRAERENNLIYHCKVCEYRDLNPLQPAIMVSAVQFDLHVKEEELLFRSLQTLDQIRSSEAAEQVRGVRLQEFTSKLNLQRGSLERALEQHMPILNKITLERNLAENIEENIESVSLSMSSVTLMRGESERIIKEIQGFLEDNDPGKRGYIDQHKQLKKTLDSAHEADRGIKERFEDLLSQASKMATSPAPNAVNPARVATLKARIASLKATYASLYEDSIRRFKDDLFDKLSVALLEQEQLINSIKGLSLEIQKSNAASPSSHIPGGKGKREQGRLSTLLSQMESDLGEAMTFYSGFQEASNKLLNNLRDFEASRALETLDIAEKAQALSPKSPKTTDHQR